MRLRRIRGIVETDIVTRERELVPALSVEGQGSDALVDEMPDVQRCSKCVLPHTFPYISFDAQGVCNYCKNYIVRNEPKPIEELTDLLEPYRRNGKPDCIIPFSGGRDSCYTLHLAVKKLGLRR